MFYDILFSVVAAIILIYIIFLLASFFFNWIFVYINRKTLQNLRSVERIEEIERISKNHNKYVSWFISKRIILSFFTFEDYKKTIIKPLNDDHKSPLRKPGVDSIILSIIIMVFSFLIIGSSFKTDVYMMELLTHTTRLISVVAALYLIYRNLELTLLQFKYDKKWIAFLALLFNVLCISYFIFVSIFSIIEIFG
jgi:hypothetical protein